MSLDPSDEKWTDIQCDRSLGTHGFEWYLSAFQECYGDEVLAKRPSAAAWIPSSDTVERANVTITCKALGFDGYEQLYRWSIADRAAYWGYVLDTLPIKLRKPPRALLGEDSPTHPNWLTGGRLNIVDSCLSAEPESAAIVTSDDSGAIETVTVGDLRRQVGRIARSLTNAGIQKGDRVCVILPMTSLAVAIYLGVVAVGAAVVCVPESFAPDEIAVRLGIAQPKLTITQDFLIRGIKTIPLYDRICQASGIKSIVVGFAGGVPVSLRAGDVDWSDFVCAEGLMLEPVEMDPRDLTCILFSSGTTGEPKAVPWDHTTPIKCAADAYFHQDIHEGDVVCWPTSLGWMMGSWLIYAALINKATIAIYTQSPLDPGFGRFVQDARVTMLGTVPTMVSTWRGSKCMEQFDWSAVRVFSSTGECSNALDCFYLMYLGGWKPIIEYCGGTEIGGAYITGVVVKSAIPATFSTPALGIDLEILDDAGIPSEVGEVYLVGPSIGLSTWLINRDHDETYFSKPGLSEGGVPRRTHGDELLALPGGYFQMLGRSDDTMNISGIKVSCVEIERVVNRVPGIAETAAAGLTGSSGGPSRLAIFAVELPGSHSSSEELRERMQLEIKKHLNPLFHLSEVRIVESLPRTASNKIIRRQLRKEGASHGK